MGPQSYIVAKKSSLFGSVEVAGAKNMVTKIMTTALIASKGRLIIRKAPFINEISITFDLFDQLGIKHKINPDKSLEIEANDFKTSEIMFNNSEGNRISLLLVAPILARFGKATISKPKGCAIGDRKIDFHTSGLKKFGVSIDEDEKFLYLKVGKKGLTGTQFKLPFPSVGATENLIITAVCASGESIIHNCAIEPEIIELIKFLQKGGVDIVIHGDRSIYIKGNLNLKLSEVTIIPDRIETFSYAVAALSTKGDVFIKGARQDLMISPLGVLIEMGAGVEIFDNGIRFFYKGDLHPVSVTTEVYPGFSTDFQQPLAILLSQINGESLIHETIFENRFQYLKSLQGLIKGKKGGIEIGTECPTGDACRFAGLGYNHLAKIRGPISFTSGDVAIPDLRAGFAIINAGLLSDGIRITCLDTLFRGYENPVLKLQQLGANITLVKV